MRWITVCGGGNGAHALVGTLLLRDKTTHIRLYLPFKEERAYFAEAVSAQSLFKVQLAGEVHSVASNRIHVTADPKEAALSPIIIMVVPAFAHGAILSQLAPYLTEGSTIVALPARSGLEYQARDILGKVGRNSCVLIGFQTLPWACRIKEFGYSVIIHGAKKRVGAACLPRKEIKEKAKIFSALLSMDVIPYQSMLELSLANTGQLIHPGIMYSVFGDRLGEVFPSENEVPLFYASVDEAAAKVLSRMSDEVIAIKEAVEERLPGLKMPGVLHLSRWLDETYSEEIKDTSSLARKFQTNLGYQTLKVPVKKVNAGYRVDVAARYLTEDVPFGLLVTKGIALVVGVETPMIDEVITNTSAWIGKEYLIDGKLIGCDVMTTRAPQRYVIDSLEELIR
jgi:hypothetical protein